MDRPSQTDEFLPCVPWPACRRERYHCNGCVAVAAIRVAKAAQTVTRPEEASNVEADAPLNNPSYNVWRSVGNNTKTVFNKDAAINTGMSGRDYLRSINAKCMATSENFYTCATVESFSGAANNNDGVLLGIDEIDKGLSLIHI